MKTLAQRIEEKIERVPWSGCWIWTSVPSSKVAQIWHQGTKTAYRVAYELWIGPIPKGKFVCHRCDVPCCVNPEHLFLGTHRDNMDDMTRKNRAVKGVAHGMSKLNEEAVREIRGLKGQTNRLAEKFGVDRTLIQMVRRGQIWSHVR